MLKDVTTQSKTYKFGLTDIDLTLCFVENYDKTTKQKIDNYFIPASLRVGDDSVSKSHDCIFVKYIFMKNNKNSKYNSIYYGDSDEIINLPIEIRNKINMEDLVHI